MKQKEKISVLSKTILNACEVLKIFSIGEGPTIVSATNKIISEYKKIIRKCK